MKRLRMLSSLLAVFLFVSSQKKQDTKAPDKDAILKATASLPTRHTDRTVTQHNIRDVSVQTPRPPGLQPPAALRFRSLFQFQTELRKILVSLIEVAQKLLALNPDAVELFKKANGEADASCHACTLMLLLENVTSDRKVFLNENKTFPKCT